MPRKNLTAAIEEFNDELEQTQKQTRQIKS